MLIFDSLLLIFPSGLHIWTFLGGYPTSWMFWALNSFAFRIQLISWTLFLWGLAKIKKLGGNRASSIWSKAVSPSLAASESSIKCLWIQTFYCHLAAMVVVLGLMYCFIECSFPGWGSFLMQVWVSALLSSYTGLWWSPRCLFSAPVPLCLLHGPPPPSSISSIQKFAELWVSFPVLCLVLVNRKGQGLTQLFLDS